MAGCTLLELQKSSVLRELVNMTEEDRIQAAVDITEAVYYIHSLSQPIVHQNISAKEKHLNAKSISKTSCPVSVTHKVEARLRFHPFNQRIAF